jgi:hypothetical protein
MSLLTYDDVKNAVKNRGLIDRISSTDPSFSMPFDSGSRVSPSNIDIIIKWQNDGFVE